MHETRGFYKYVFIDSAMAYYIVVDTNILISELNLVTELKDIPLNGCGPPHIFIAWHVIQELDKLKCNKKNKRIVRAVSDAVFYLNTVLGTHPRFHEQTPMEVEEWSQPFSSCNDDKILECCMALGDKMPKDKVILLTNDRNLVNKALILCINVHNWKSLFESIKPDVKFNFSKYGNRSSKRNNSEGNETGRINETATADQAKQKMLQERNVHKQSIHKIMRSARQLFKDNLCRFLEIEMREVYGSTWHSSFEHRNLLDGILEAVLKYWTEIFSAFMTGEDKQKFELLCEKVSRPAGFLADDAEECLVILSSVSDIFHSIKRRRPMIKVPLNRIEEFQGAILDAFLAFNKIDSIVKQVEQESVLVLFNRDWNAINQLCGLVLDTCGIQHDFQYEKPDRMLSLVQLQRIICDLYPVLQQLKIRMFAMHSAIQECKPTKNIVKKLSQSLLNFIPSLALSCFERFTCPHFSVRALEVFCTNPQNRKMIEIGCKQIEKHFTKLDEALIALLRNKV